VSQWLAHEGSIPALRVPRSPSTDQVEAVVQASLDRLGIGPDFGLLVQQVIAERRHGHTIVRVQLTLGRGPGAMALANHGVLVFRRDGSLADYHAPLPADVFSQVQAGALLGHARHLGLDRRGGALSLAAGGDGELTVETRVLRGDGMAVWLEVFSLDAPEGERREVVSGSWAGDAQGLPRQDGGITVTGDRLHE
jgi:hypothetical protein